MTTTLEVKREIKAPVEKVWSLSSDFPNADKVVNAIVRMEMLTDGPVGLGTRFKETRVIFKKEASEEMEVSIWEPPHRYALDAESHGTKYHSVLLFKPTDAGTEVTMQFNATPITLFSKVMSVLAKPMMKSMMKMVCKDLDDLAAAAEATEA